MANRRRKRKSDETKVQDSSKMTEDGGSRAQSSSKKSASHTRKTAKTEQPLVETIKQPLFPALPSLSRVMSVVMLMIGILAVGALFYQVMAGFFVPLFLATLLVVIFRPVHQWIYERSGQRPRVAALATTLLILTVVLMPVIVILSVATSQFTAMVSHVRHFDDLSNALDRARERFSLTLVNAEQFRRIDALADTFDEEENPEEVLANIDEAIKLIYFLQGPMTESPAVLPETQTEAAAVEDDLGVAPRPAEQEAKNAVALLKDLSAVISEGAAASNESSDIMIALNAQERFHGKSVAASAAIRTWMRELLGGTLSSQAKLLANPSEAEFAKLLRTGREALQPRFVQLTSATGVYLLRITVSLLILIVAVYFFLLDGPSMIRTLMRLSPMDDNYERRLLTEFDRTSRAVVLASVLSALVQGVLAAIAFWFFGFDSVILLFLLTSMMALVPFLGAASVWIPCALWLGAVEQRWGAAIILAIYGMTVVSSIDNVIKMYVLHGRSTLHPLFALLSVFGGVSVFGPIGVLVGPMVVVFLQTLLEILNHELVSTETDESQQERAAEFGRLEKT